MSADQGWIGVDLDGTLAHYEGWNGGAIGAPIPKMVERVKAWLAEGKTVKIVTARVCGRFTRVPDVVVQISDDARVEFRAEWWREAVKQECLVKAWCLEHLGRELEVTALKDFGMIELWDDRAVQVLLNTGVQVFGLTFDECAKALQEAHERRSFTTTDKRRVT